jgi:hypothetical protein
VESLETRLYGLNPGITIIRSFSGTGLVGKLWGLSALHNNATKQQALNWAVGEKPKFEALGNLSGFAPAVQIAAPLPAHDTRIGSASIILDDPLPDAAFDLWLDTLISDQRP